MMPTALVTPATPAGQPSVRLLTALAETADLSDAAYRAIYDRVAAGRSLRNIALALRSEVTFGWWAAYAAGEKALSRERKNELRAWAGLPELPPGVQETVAAHVHLDAAVFSVGEQISIRVILVGADVPSVTLRVNGDCHIISTDPALEARQTPCNARYTPPPRGTIHPSRSMWKRLNARRLAAGQTWDEFLAPLEEDGE